MRAAWWPPSPPLVTRRATVKGVQAHLAPTRNTDPVMLVRLALIAIAIIVLVPLAAAVGVIAALVPCGCIATLALAFPR